MNTFETNLKINAFPPHRIFAKNERINTMKVFQPIHAKKNMDGSMTGMPG
jgi:hypothetical protein